MSGFQFEEGLPSDQIALTVNDTIEAGEMAEFIKRIEAIIETGNKAKVYIDFSSYSFEPSVVGEKLNNISTLWNGIGRMAYVVDSATLRSLVGLVDAVTPMHIRAFDHAQADEARAWVFGE